MSTGPAQQEIVPNLYYPSTQIWPTTSLSEFDLCPTQNYCDQQACYSSSNFSFEGNLPRLSPDSASCMSPHIDEYTVPNPIFANQMPYLLPQQTKVYPSNRNKHDSQMNHVGVINQLDYENIHHPSLDNFAEDILQKSHQIMNECALMNWCWGVVGQIPQEIAHHDYGDWSSEPIVMSPQGSTLVPCQEEVAATPAAFPRFSEVAKPMQDNAICLDEGIRKASTQQKELLPIQTSARQISFKLSRLSSHEPKPSVLGSQRRHKPTSEKRRRNHILYEKKRREKVKNSFDDLFSLVPELVNNQLSKSTILFKAAECLDALVSGNKILKAQARALGSSDVQPKKMGK
ncbi:hypothetical protein QQS21_000379 [Conoideocrella luteorostrata]|uniref:BHLH domain-containing protein n=1 Tax=Conoideocrella luteorostrata TaxID=1105319 RepID=A0AAJ0D181_9HYPO|nr:hypothetical protein QQS21_000379 [Conoideocrella luteorostrata]